MAAVKDNSSYKHRNWVRVFIQIDYGSRQLCHDVLYKKEKWSTDGVQFFRRLEPEQSRICQFNIEHQILCPSSGFTDHCDVDLTLFSRVIEVIFGSKYESLLKDVNNLRNQECHRGNKELPDTDFDTIWKCTADILQNHSFDLSLVDDLKDGDLFLDQ